MSSMEPPETTEALIIAELSSWEGRGSDGEVTDCCVSVWTGLLMMQGQNNQLTASNVAACFLQNK